MPEGCLAGGCDEDGHGGEGEEATQPSKHKRKRVRTTAKATATVTSGATYRQPPRDRRAPRVASGGKQVDCAIVKLCNHLTENTGIQDRLQSTVQEDTRPCVAFCQWMGLEVANLDEQLWTAFTQQAFEMVTCYRQLQDQQPAAPHPHPPHSQAS